MVSVLPKLWDIIGLEYRFLSYLYRGSIHFKIIIFFSRNFEDLWHELGETTMRLLNFRCRNVGVILSDQLIFQCPKCKAFAIGFTKPFFDLKRFCSQGHCPNRQGAVFFLL